MWKNAIAIFFLVILAVIAETGNCQTESRSNTLIFTVFDTASAGSYAYLRDSVRGIMTSRLAARPGVAVLDRSLSEQELAALKNRQPGEKVKGVADYLVSGGLYGLKSGLSIQVIVYPMAVEQEVLRFERLVKNQENLLPELERLVGEIAVALGADTTPVAKVGPLSGGGGEGTAAFVTAHPEAAYKKSQHTGTIAGAAGSSIGVKAKDGKRNLTLGGEIRAFAAGDVDGGGDEEMVILSGATLELYRLEGKNIVKAGGAKLPAALECHALNLADLDNDGRKEIYLSCTDGLAVASQIVRWQQATSQFVVTAAHIPWYLRPLSLPGKGWRLAGQKRGVEKTELLKAGVYLLEQRGDGQGLVEAERLPLPSGVNLFDFVFADLDGDRAYETVAIDGKERMKVYNSTNELLWVSKNNYGGSKVYLGPSRAGAVNDQDRKNFTVDEDFQRHLVFVPGRLLVSDVDGNGREEVAVNQNSQSALSFLEKMRIYNDGVIVGLAWDGEAMVESWRSGAFRGYIVGFSLSPKTPGGVWHSTAKAGVTIDAGLYVAHLPRSGSWTGLLPGVGETQLTAYDLQFSDAKTK
jgi:FG-GAP-like repeat